MMKSILIENIKTATVDELLEAQKAIWQAVRVKHQGSLVWMAKEISASLSGCHGLPPLQVKTINRHESFIYSNPLSILTYNDVMTLYCLNDKFS
jgi:hypothetical protein